MNRRRFLIHAASAVAGVYSLHRGRAASAQGTAPALSLIHI